MNNTFRPPKDLGALVERIYNQLSQYMDVVDLAEYVSTNPSINEMIDKLNDLAAAKSNAKGPKPLQRWVTDHLSSKPGHKEYKPA